MTKLTKQALKAELAALFSDHNLQHVIDGMTDEDLTWLAQNRELIAKRFKAANGHLDHPFIMSIWDEVNRTRFDFELSPQDITLFEEITSQLNDHDFGYLQYPKSIPQASTNLRFMILCLQATSNRALIQMQQDAWEYAFNHSKLFHDRALLDDDEQMPQGH
jgi:hypothetical protein